MGRFFQPDSSYHSNRPRFNFNCKLVLLFQLHVAVCHHFSLSIRAARHGMVSPACHTTLNFSENGSTNVQIIHTTFHKSLERCYQQRNNVVSLLLVITDAWVMKLLRSVRWWFWLISQAGFAVRKCAKPRENIDEKCGNLAANRDRFLCSWHLINAFQPLIISYFRRKKRKCVTSRGVIRVSKQ